MQLEHALILLRLVHAEVVQQLAALCNFSEESAACRMILLVILQVSSEQNDFLREDRDLNLWGAGVLFVSLTVGDKLLLGAALDCHKGIG